MSLIISTISVQHITKALKSLINKTKLISKADYNLDSETKGFSEFIELFDHFNIMKENIKERENRIQHINEELEDINQSLEEEISERHKAEEILIESESQFRNAVENAPIPIMLRTEDGEVLKISRAWTEITGYTQKDIPTINEWANRAYGINNQEIQAKIVETFEPNIKHNYEFPVRTNLKEIRKNALKQEWMIIFQNQSI